MSYPSKYVYTSFCFLFSLIILSCGKTQNTGETSSFNSEELDRFITHKMDSLEIMGLSIAVVKNNSVHYQGYYGYANKEQKIPVDSTTIFEAASISKSVFAYFTMTMVAQGKLDLDQPLYEYLPLEGFEDHPYAQMLTARMVLSHTTGLPNWRFLEEDGQLNFKFKPGTSFNYSGEGYEYLANVLAHINNTDRKGLEIISQKEVFKPIGMDNSGFTITPLLKKNMATGYEGLQVGESLPEDFPYFGAAFSVVTNVNDFSKFLITLSRKQTLNETLYNELFSEQVILPADESLRTEDGFNAWGLGFIRTETPYGIKLAHGGMNPSFQGYFMIIPEKEFGFVFFTNSTNGLQMYTYLEAYFEKHHLMQSAK